MQQIDRVTSLTTQNTLKLKSNKCQDPSWQRNWQTWKFLARKFHGKLSENTYLWKPNENLLRLCLVFMLLHSGFGIES